MAVTPPDALEDPTQLHPTNRKLHPPGTKTVDRARIIIYDNRIHVAVDSPTGPTLVFRENIISHTKSPERVHYVMTEFRKSIAFRRDDNCGCGSRLRSWNPYGTIMTAE